ncbi:carbamate kinase [Limimonas halophila]|uniref:Carbamate kinase n=1 Tax=Limimonas halophila TaxID=1082479 RepID=A0A1G7Q047_9PROT|nr:carbamate kinase [Limimonas halophila]SDF91841.1 carbamate kinase [Limimonas halophila]
MRIVVALGGNALLRRGEPLEAAQQQKNVAAAVDAIEPIARHHELVVTHGNGPQIGLLALQADAYKDVSPYPLDVLGAESEGMIGYIMEQEFQNRLPGREVATLLTQVEVYPDDPAFQHPEKFIGPVYEKEEADRLARERGWTVAPDGDKWRRVVPSPEPRRILELKTIRLLMDHHVMVICSGGGGIPVVLREGGGFHGIEGVIDKDKAAALLAQQLGADGLIMLTDVDAVYTDWGTDKQAPIRHISPAKLRQHRFASGSMGPKVEAACRVVEGGGTFAAIGRLQDAGEILAGRAGTIVGHAH